MHVRKWFTMCKVLSTFVYFYSTHLIQSQVIILINSEYSSSKFVTETDKKPIKTEKNMVKEK